MVYFLTRIILQYIILVEPVPTAAEDVSLNYVGDFVGDFAPRTCVSMREIVESKMVAAKLFVFIDSD